MKEANDAVKLYNAGYELGYKQAMYEVYVLLDSGKIKQLEAKLQQELES